MAEPASLPSFSLSSEDVLFCDVVIRLCPRLGFAEICKRVSEDSRRRGARIRRLRERIERGTYRAPETRVADAMVAQLDPGWLS